MIILKQLLHTLLYIPRHEKLTDKNIMHFLTVSSIGIILCFACMGSLAFAWFSINLEAKPQIIASANFNVSISILDGQNEPVSPIAENSYTLSAGQEYTVILTATGTASSGYCVVSSVSDAQQHIASLIAGETLQFKISPAEDEQYTFTAAWGTSPKDADIENGTIIA